MPEQTAKDEGSSAAGAAPIAPKHTPGPWRVHPYEINVGPYNKGRDVGPAGRAVAQVIGAFEEPTPGDEAEANARLIAAAPDLLEALKRMRAITHQHISPACDAADAAIASAEKAGIKAGG